MMWGQVKTSFANPYYLQNNCKTPIQVNTWDENFSESMVGQTCLTIDDAAQGFHNYQQFMDTWTGIARAGGGSIDQASRPQPVGLFLTNTTVNGSWVNVIDTPKVSAQFNRVVNNVTLAFPHAGVFQAARDPRNNILQPEVRFQTSKTHVATDLTHH
jgi:hypothetical protein